MGGLTPAYAEATERFFLLWPSAQDTPKYRVTTPSHWSPVPPSALQQVLSSSALQQVLLGGIAHGWLVAEPLLITVELDEDGYYIASDDIFAVYGDGSTANEALQDYIVSLLDYYQLLSARAEDDPPTQVLFRRLQSFIRPVVQ